MSGFKSRAAYDGARTVVVIKNLTYSVGIKILSATEQFTPKKLHLIYMD